MTVRKKIVVVLGMHRSGTSAITRAIHALGVGLGDNLIPASEGINDRGFWEDFDINALNIELLQALGYDWHTLSPIPAAEVFGDTTHKFVERATALLRSKLESATIFGFKDPRLPRLLPFWKHVFDVVGVEASYILTCRNPLSVASSLEKRNNFDVGKSLLLWFDHVTCSIRYTSGCTRLVVDYDRLIDNFIGELQRISDFLGIKFNPAASEVANFGNLFLESSLRHTHFSRADLAQNPTVPRSVATLFDLLQSAAENAVSLEQPETIARLAHLDVSRADWSSLFRYADDCELLIADLAREKTCLLQRIVRSEEEKNALNSEVASLRRETAVGERRLADLTASIAERNQLNESLQNDITRRDVELTKLAATVSERDSRLASIESALGERANRLSVTLSAMEQLEAKANRLERLNAESGGRFAQLTRESQISSARIQSLNQMVDALRGSRSWRATLPFRILGSHIRHTKHFPESFRTTLLARGGWRASARTVIRLARTEGIAALGSRLTRIYKRVGLGSAILPAGEQRLELATRSALTPMHRSTAALRYRPLISVVMPTFNTPQRFLAEVVESVRAQDYDHWELCICDDGSTNAETLAMLASLPGSDKRIKVSRKLRNSGISAATNEALALATGEYVALLDHDDILTSDALTEVAFALNEDPERDVLYTDQAKIDETGKLFEPFYKPDWSPDYFRRVMYVGHLLVFRRSLLQTIGLFDSTFDKVQDYEFMLRLSEATSNIHHIPKVLYYWRAIVGSIALDPHGKSGIDKLQVAAVTSHLFRQGVSGSVFSHKRFAHRVVIEPAASDRSQPLVSIVIPTKDAPEHIKRCLDSIFARSTYANVEVILVDNGTKDPKALAAFRRDRVVVIPFLEPFNYSRANNLGASHASGEYLIFLNNDTEVVAPDWIEHLLFNLYQHDVAAVGPLLLYPDNTVQHAGVVLGCRGTADHVMRGFPRDSDGYAGSLSCTREVSAVTAACLMCRRADYESIGGMNEYFATHYQDIDLCLRLAHPNRRILYVPQAVLYHFESATRGCRYDYLDRLLLLDLWEKKIARPDPYYNPQLCLSRLDYSVTTAKAEDA